VKGGRGGRKCLKRDKVIKHLNNINLLALGGLAVASYSAFQYLLNSPSYCRKTALNFEVRNGNWAYIWKRRIPIPLQLYFHNIYIYILRIRSSILEAIE